MEGENDVTTTQPEVIEASEAPAEVTVDAQAETATVPEVMDVAGTPTEDAQAEVVENTDIA